LSLIIEPDGSISEVNVEKGIGCGLDEEAIRLAKLVKKWTPAIEKGIYVRAKYDLPVKFILSEDKKESVDFIGLYDHDIAYTYTEIPARFPGGENDLEKYIEAVMIYPKEAKEKNIEGRVFISFIVERDGSLSDITLVRKLGFGCDEEAIRIVKTMPNWEPAQQNKHIIRFRATLPVKFKLRKTQNN
jgi:TonB family protein